MPQQIPERYYVADAVSSKRPTGFHIPADITPEEIDFLELVKRNMIFDLRDDRTRLVFVLQHYLGWSEGEISKSTGHAPALITRQKHYIKKRLTKYKQGYM